MKAEGQTEKTAVNGVAARSKAMNKAEARSFDKQPCTAKHGHSQRCLNPVCRNEVEPNAKGDKFYCRDVCRQQASIIRRAAKLFEGLSDDEVIQLVRS